MRSRCLLFSSVFFVAAGLGETGRAAAEGTATPVPTANEDADKSAKKKISKLSWSGRVFVRNTATRQRLAGETYWRNSQFVDSARVGMRYKHKSGALAVIKLEFEDDDPRLRDAYIRIAAHPSLDINAGRFKRPMSGIGLASKWDLPSIERGLLDSIRVEGQDLPFAGGRGDGVSLEYEPPVSMDVELSAGIFQNKLGTGGVSLDAAKHFAQDVYFRASVEPRDDLEVASSVGFFGYLGQIGDPNSFDHAPVGSVEVSYQPKWLLLWVEGFAGKSMFAKADGTTTGNFLGARALVAPNLRTTTPRRLQPFVGASYFDPRQSEANDANSEVQGGMNLAFTKIWRLQFEVDHTFAHGISSSATAGTAFHVQLGARFKE